jgi:hypothetical protein
MRFRVLAALAAAILAFTACSSGGSDRLTEAEFLEAVNAICKAGNDRIQERTTEFGAAVGAAGEAGPSPDVPQGFIDDVVADYRGQVADIRELEPPEDLEGDVDGWLSTADSTLDEVADTPIEELFASRESPFADVSEKAEALGATECTEDAGDAGTDDTTDDTGTDDTGTDDTGTDDTTDDTGTDDTGTDDTTDDTGTDDTTDDTGTDDTTDDTM